MPAAVSTGLSAPPPTLPAFIMDFSLFRYAKHLRLLGCDVICSQDLRQEEILPIAESEDMEFEIDPRHPSPLLSALMRGHVGGSGSTVRSKRIVLTASRKLVDQLDAKWRHYWKARDGEGAQEEPAERKRIVVAYDSDGESIYESDSDDGGDEPPPPWLFIDSRCPFKSEIARVMTATGVTYQPSTVFTRCGACNDLIEDVDDKETIRAEVHPSIFSIYQHFYRCPRCRKVYWGMDDGVLVNFKALRTAQYLTGLQDLSAADPRGATQAATSSPPTSTLLKRHFLCYPRQVKCLVLSFLSPAEDAAIEQAFPGLRLLIETVRRGGSWKFVPERKQLTDGSAAPPQPPRRRGKRPSPQA